MILTHHISETLRPKPIGKGTRRLLLKKASHRQFIDSSSTVLSVQHPWSFTMHGSMRENDLFPHLMLKRPGPERNRNPNGREIPSKARHPP
jgi:hypothetical protein